MDIHPKVEALPSGKLLATMAYPVRNRVWTIIHDIQNHVVDINSRDVDDTQIQLSVNAGYQKSIGLAVMVSAIYLAMTDFQELIRVPTISQHVRRINATITYPGMSLSADEIKPFLATYIVKEADKHLDKFKSSNRIRLSYFDTHYNTVLEAKARLSAVSMFSIAPWEKTRRDQLCAQTLLTLHNWRLDAEELNDELKELHDAQSRIAANGMVIIVDNPFGCNEVLTQTAESIHAKALLVDARVDDFVANHDAQLLVNDVLAVCPAAPVVVKEK